MTSEFDPRDKNKGEKAELTPVEKAQKEILDHVNGEDHVIVNGVEVQVKDIKELHETRFKAFSDFADYQKAEFPDDIDPRSSFENRMRLLLVDETIRQRINGVPGYKNQLDKTSELYKKLNFAMDSTNDGQVGNIGGRNENGKIMKNELSEIIKFLQATKNIVIERNSQQFLTPPKK